MIYMRIVSLITLTMLMVACSGEGTPDTAVEDTETMTYYAQFRDPQHNRVVIFVFKEGISTQEVKSHSKSLAHKEDRLLAVYYYPEGGIGLPPTRLSRSGNIIRANDLMYDDAEIPPWHYAFLRPFTGEPRFIECFEAPADVLCRQN